MLEKAVIAVEDPDRASNILDVAVDILSATGAEPILLRVYSESEFREYLDTLGYDSADPTEVAERNEAIQECAKSLRAVGLESQVVGRTGDPAEEIIKYVANGDVDHVFLGARRRSAAGKAILGSVSQQVLRSVDAPCTIAME